MVVKSGQRWSMTAIMWRCVCLFAVLCTAVSRCDPLKRAEMSPVPFVMGSRYGRSPPRMIAPRNDRFFMGSRYGKRSQVIEGEPTHGWRAPLCDCAHFVKHTQPRTYFNRRLDTSRRVSMEG